MSSLLDQSALTDLASRLVAAAGAPAPTRLTPSRYARCRCRSTCADGAVEESQRAESDDVGLRVLVGRRQASISTNDIKGDGVDALAERAIAMARVAPEDKFAG